MNHTFLKMQNRYLRYRRYLHFSLLLNNQLVSIVLFVGKCIDIVGSVGKCIKVAVGKFLSYLQPVGKKSTHTLRVAPVGIVGIVCIKYVYQIFFQIPSAESQQYFFFFLKLKIVLF